MEFGGVFGVGCWGCEGGGYGRRVRYRVKGREKERKPTPNGRFHHALHCIGNANNHKTQLADIYHRYPKRSSWSRRVPLRKGSAPGLVIRNQKFQPQAPPSRLASTRLCAALLTLAGIYHEYPKGNELS